MKRIGHLFILGTLVLTATTTVCQQVHTIRGLDFYYDPDTLWMQAGDSVRFQTAGIHDMVQTDSSYWAIGQAIGNGGFHTVIGADTTFAIDTAGTYYFVCSPHGPVGMHGVLLVEPVITAVPLISEVDLKLFPNPCNEVLNVELDGVAHVEFFDACGRSLLASTTLLPGRNQIDMTGLSPGMYVLRIQRPDGVRIGRPRTIVVGPK